MQHARISEDPFLNLADKPRAPKHERAEGATRRASTNTAGVPLKSAVRRPSLGVRYYATCIRFWPETDSQCIAYTGVVPELLLTLNPSRSRFRVCFKAASKDSSDGRLCTLLALPGALHHAVRPSQVSTKCHCVDQTKKGYAFRRQVIETPGCPVSVDHVCSHKHHTQAHRWCC